MPSIHSPQHNQAYPTYLHIHSTVYLTCPSLPYSTHSVSLSYLCSPKKPLRFIIRPDRRASPIHIATQRHIYTQMYITPTRESRVATLGLPKPYFSHLLFHQFSMSRFSLLACFGKEAKRETHAGGRDNKNTPNAEWLSRDSAIGSLKCS